MFLVHLFTGVSPYDCQRERLATARNLEKKEGDFAFERPLRKEGVCLGFANMDGPQHVQELSARKRYMLFGMACTHVLLASGEAYGWTALRPVLLNSGIFDGSATPAEQASK